MARPTANNVDYFPTWKPRKSFSYLKDILDPDVFVDYIRNSYTEYNKKDSLQTLCVSCNGRKVS